MTIVWFLVALGILVTFHEWGHFYVARKFNILIERFSVGFGSPLWSTYDRKGTQFAIAAIPLGGYVKMLQADDHTHPDDPNLFNNKKLWQKAAVMLAGPLANFLLAIVFFTILALLGQERLMPVVGYVAPNSPAAIAGIEADQQIRAIDGIATDSWQSVQDRLFQRVGETGTIDVAVSAFGSDEQPNIISLPIKDWLVDQEPPDMIGGLGFGVRPPIKEVIVRAVNEGSPAALGGLLPDDHIIAVDGLTVADWRSFTSYIQAKGGKAVGITVVRGQNEQILEVTPVTEKGKGFIGVAPKAPDIPKEYRFESRHSLLTALPAGIESTWERSVFVLVSVKKLFQGDLSIKNLSGPITIAKVAGDTARRGFKHYLFFLAYLSVSLAVFNLLPIPMLDGGHLLFYLIESVKGSPVPENVQAVLLIMGLVFLGGVMLLASYFDVLRVF